MHFRYRLIDFHMIHSMKEKIKELRLRFTRKILISSKHERKKKLGVSPTAATTGKVVCFMITLM